MRNYNHIESVLVDFLKNYLMKSGAKNLLLGVSGGLDSAVVATLCMHAMSKNTYALIMPTDASSLKNVNDAVDICNKLEIHFKILNIQNILNAFKNCIDEDLSHIRMGNLSARVRMSLLYDYSVSLNAIVIGTSNKSELMLGYGTIFGDLACAINPIGELYKTEIFEFARYLGVDDTIIQKSPSADLWEGQSDEEDIGYSYETIDRILKEIEMGKCSNEEKAFNDISKRVNLNQFKRQMPLIARI
ncbi:MAG: NAD+ synthase [Campylobacter sp.]|nr:NAD+ synthase [Campylobacter sp.]